MEDFFFIIITVIILVLIVLGYIWYDRRKNNPKPKKKKGRENKYSLAVNAAKRFAAGNGFKIISPAHLAGNNSFANLDAVVIGYFGVLGIKALGYNGEIYGDANEEKWLHVSEDGSRDYFDNPIVEASADVRVIRHILMGSRLKQIPIEVICVFTDKKAQIALPRSTGHYTMQGLKELLGKDKYLEDKGFDLEKVYKSLEEALVLS